MVVLAASSLVSSMNAAASGSMMMLLYTHGSVRWSDLYLVVWYWFCSDVLCSIRQGNIHRLTLVMSHDHLGSNHSWGRTWTLSSILDAGDMNGNLKDVTGWEKHSTLTIRPRGSSFQCEPYHPQCHTQRW